MSSPPERLQINEYLAYDPQRVTVEHYAVSPLDFTDFDDGLNYADLVVPTSLTRVASARTAADGVEIDQALLVHVELSSSHDGQLATLGRNRRPAGQNSIKPSCALVASPQSPWLPIRNCDCAMQDCRTAREGQEPSS